MKTGKPPSGVDLSAIKQRLKSFQIETPSWAFADSGTRFGTFKQPGAAVTIEEKLQDAGWVHRFTGITPTVAVHVLWDFPEGADAKVVDTAREHGVAIGAINPNVFQDPDYKYGSLAHRDETIRRRAVDHCLESVDLAKKLGSKIISLWLADGTNFPGQDSIVERKHRLAESVSTIHRALTPEMELLIEYKPFEPAFYHTDIADWGMAYVLSKSAGSQAKVLIDIGHHLPGTNVEHIVAFLIDEGMLGGFHFNDHKYADDDLTSSSIDPYQLFRIFHEIFSAEALAAKTLPIAYMVDQNHNLKPKVEAMIQTVCMIQELAAKALLVDRKALAHAQRSDDIVLAETLLRKAFFTEVGELLSDVRKELEVPTDPLTAFRESDYLQQVARSRADKRKS